MTPARHLTSLRTAFLFMAGCGLVVGALFLLYSGFFFGSKAFTPLFALGSVAAGLTVAACCCLIVRQLLKALAQRHWLILTGLSGAEGNAPGEHGFQQLLQRNEALMGRVALMEDTVSGLAAEIHARNIRLTSEFDSAVSGTEKQTLKEKETLKAVDEMNLFFNDLLKGIEDIAARTEERASISTEMSATTDAIAQNIKDYSASVLDTSVSIEEMASSIRETATNIEALTTSTEQTCNSINDIGTSITDIRDNARRSSEYSEKVRVQAMEGMDAMAATIAAMLEIERNNDYSVEAIRRLSLHSLRVGEFLKVIRDVVAQTNLLSLNASIIAAQAGEQGKSFAVVAEEVRALAQRTAASTAEIEELVRNIQLETAAAEKAVTQGKDKVSEGMRISHQADEALHRIEESASEASRMVQKIAEATDEQAASSRMINDEAKKNLTRVQHVTKAIQEEERGAALIVKSLEQMRALSRKITTSTEEQARGNRLHMKSVLEDNERVKELRGTCIQQIMMGDVLRNDVTDMDRLVADNAGEIKKMLSEITATNEMIAAIQAELAHFNGNSPV